MIRMTRVVESNVAGDTLTYDERRRHLLGNLTGSVLEIGAGKGANFGRLSPEITWYGLEPDVKLCRVLVRTADLYGRAQYVVRGVAEHLPFADQSMDAVVATVVLCSVADQRQVLAEIRRVLRPGGEYFFFEHVAGAPKTWSRRAQEVYAPISRRLFRGCDPSRETWRAIEDAGFADVELRTYDGAWPLVIMGPHILGIARA
jgi:ubiquinone/menaquinone biosynthesis C-methylase UbiE